jgi:predicted RND superfamily exporter protein
MSELTPDERKTADEARPPDTLQVLGPSDLPPLLRRRFTEQSGAVGTVFYVKPSNDIVFADGRNHIRLSKISDNVHLPNGTVVMTASRSTIFAELLSSLRRDGPLASVLALLAVALVVSVFSRSRRVAFAVLGALALGVAWFLGGAAWSGSRLNYVNFIALPITFGIGCEYAFNLADRARLLGGDVAQAVSRSAGAVLLCSFTTTVGYGSLLFSDFQALESFGKLAVFGEIACVFAAVFVMPSMLTLGERRASP